MHRTARVALMRLQSRFLSSHRFLSSLSHILHTALTVLQSWLKMSTAAKSDLHLACAKWHNEEEESSPLGCGWTGDTMMLMMVDDKRGR